MLQNIIGCKLKFIKFILSIIITSFLFTLTSCNMDDGISYGNDDIGGFHGAAAFCDEYIGAEENIKFLDTFEDKGVYSLYGDGFKYNDTIKTLDLSQIKTIYDSYAFAFSSVEEINFREIMYLSPNCFLGCQNLKEIKLPDSLVYIQDYGFAQCHLLKKVYFEGGLEFISDKAFINCHKDLTFYGKKGTIIEEYAIKHNIKFVEWNGDAND